MKAKPAKKRQRTNLTAEKCEKIKMLAAYGLTDEQISVVVDIPERSLQRHAAQILKEGRIMASAKVAESAYRQAISGNTPAMTMFWLKCRCGWREVARDETDEDKLEKVKEAVKDIVAALNQAKQPAKVAP